MLLINEDAKPEETVYYTASCALKLLKDCESQTPDDLYAAVVEQYNEDLDYSTFVLGLDFLFLVDKVKIEKEKIKCI